MTTMNLRWYQLFQWIATIAVCTTCHGEDFKDFKESALSRLSATDRTFVEAALAKNVKGLSQKTWKVGDAGVVSDAMKAIEVIDEKTAVVKINGGVYGVRGITTSGWKIGGGVKSNAYVVIGGQEEFETAKGKQKYRAITALTEEGRLTWLAIAELSKFPIFERHDFVINSAKVSAIFIGMKGEEVGIITTGSDPSYTPIEELTEADQKWVRQKIREYAAKKR